MPSPKNALQETTSVIQIVQQLNSAARFCELTCGSARRIPRSAFPCLAAGFHSRPPIPASFRARIPTEQNPAVNCGAVWDDVFVLIGGWTFSFEKAMARRARLWRKRARISMSRSRRDVGWSKLHVRSVCSSSYLMNASLNCKGARVRIQRTARHAGGWDAR